MNKNITKGLISAGVLLTLSTTANAALDFTNVTAAIDATTIVAAITSIASIKILPGVARWGYTKVISWFH